CRESVGNERLRILNTAVPPGPGVPSTAAPGSAVWSLPRDNPNLWTQPFNHGTSTTAGLASQRPLRHSSSMPPYEELFPVGALVRIASQLEQVKQTWRFHHPCRPNTRLRSKARDSQTGRVLPWRRRALRAGRYSGDVARAVLVPVKLQPPYVLATSRAFRRASTIRRFGRRSSPPTPSLHRRAISPNPQVQSLAGPTPGSRWKSTMTMALASSLATRRT